MKESEINSAPYEQVASIYDKMMSHVNYRQWAKYIRNLYFYYPSKVEKIYDISCGTGRLLPYLRHGKRKIYGSDLSPDMLIKARRNLSAYEIPVWCADARQPAVKPMKFDLIIMLYDSMNYLIEETAVTSLLGNVADSLKEKGLFLFDIVTIKGCRDHFHNYYESDAFDGMSYVRRSWFSRKDHMQYNHFSINKNGEVFIELHKQKIRSVNDWKDIIVNSPFEIINFYDNFSYRPVHKNSERIHILCQKNV